MSDDTRCKILVLTVPAHASLLRLHMQHLRAFYDEQERLNWARLDGTAGTEDVDRTTAQNRMRQEVLTAERSTVIHLRDQGRIDDEVLRLVERELDLEEQNLQRDW